MARKYDEIKWLAQATAEDLSADAEKWKGFLTTAGRLYRYPFMDQLLIYAQRPDATACAELETLELKKLPKEQIKERVQELLVLTDLNGLAGRYPNQLSGGQRQRVAFARALAPNPVLLLLGEPFAAIDAKVRGELRTWLREMIYKVGITSIFVTHDEEETRR